MKTAKTMALMAMGGLSVLAYQKYSKPVMKKMTASLNKIDEKLEDM